jgi:phosphoribosylformylglycinamidine synthase subunit PurQ / glutaminase
MRQKIVFVLYCIGFNCEEETMEIIRRAGGKPVLVFLDDLLKGRIKITDCDAFAVPGGFSYGDHIDAGRIVFLFIQQQLLQLVEAGIPIIGKCNGTQALIPSGIFGKDITMEENDSGVFCSNPFVKHRVQESNCIWTAGMEGKVITFPCAHRFGKYAGNLENANVVMTYEGFTPNGGKIAAICSDDGRNMIVMDHPERNLYNPDCVQIYRNGLKAA